jgi:biopolymer transport protein ExbB
MNQTNYFKLPIFLLGLSAAFLFSHTTSVAKESDDEWWNEDWMQRQILTIDSSAFSGAGGEQTLLLRVADSSIFASAREDGSDLRVVSSDGETVLPHHLERYDGILGEAFIWVKIPDIKIDKLFLYFGNPNAPAPDKGADAYTKDLAAVYHFSETGSIPADATSNGNAAVAPAMSIDGAIIGSGTRLTTVNTITIQANESLNWIAGGGATISFWVKSAAPQANAVLLSRGDGAQTFKILLDNGMPIIQVGNTRSSTGSPIAMNSWNHIAIIADSGTSFKLFVNGEIYGTANAALPALTGPISLGSATSGFAGDLDELRFYNTALNEASLKLAFVNQSGSEASIKLISAGITEAGEAAGGGHVMEHLMLFGDIAKNMMFDGWIAIGICVIMIVVGWTVAIKKFTYLNKIQKGNKVFLMQWRTLSADLTALDHTDGSSVKSLGGIVDEDDQDLMKDSPLYHIYHIGVEEVRQRLHKLNDKDEGLPGRSIQAIRATLDAGSVHENHRLTDGLVYLTMSVAGGPYVGLLGTVVGVMITFAIIAKSGEVNVNSIAPGIASALLATVVGLVVAIPALFIYSYLNGRIKNVMASMHVFIDEFVAKMAELHRPQSESNHS